MSAGKRPRAVSPFTNDPRGPLELISALAGQTTYRVPAQIRETPHPTDIAGALGMVEHRLGALIAQVVATRNEGMIGAVVRQSYRPVLRAVSASHRGTVRPSALADRWRIRIVLYDVTVDLMFPERQMTLGDAAMRAKMRKSGYMHLYKVVRGVLCTQMDEALSEFGKKMRAAGAQQTAQQADERAQQLE
jgi:hypothetical protein